MYHKKAGSYWENIPSEEEMPLTVEIWGDKFSVVNGGTDTHMCEAFPKVTKVTCVIDIDVKKHMYMAEVVANRLGTTAVGAKEFSESSKSVIDTAAARAERQLLKMRVKARKGNVRAARKGSVRN